MKINVQATREKIRERYGSVRKFAIQCMEAYGLASIPAAYDLVGKTLREERGRSEKSVSWQVRLRLESESLLVYENKD